MRYRSMKLVHRAKDGKPGELDFSWSSESAKVLRYDWDLGVVPEILVHDPKSVDLSPVKDAGSVLKNHNPDRIIGRPLEVWIDGPRARGLARMRFLTTAGAVEAQQEVNEGGLRGVSFGYDYRIEDVIRLGADAEYEAAGRTFKGPALIVPRWAVFELTFTPIPADSSVGIGRDDVPMTPEEATRFIQAVRGAGVAKAWGRGVVDSGASLEKAHQIFVKKLAAMGGE